MNIITFYNGKLKGDTGTNGINGLSLADVDDRKINNPLSNCLLPNLLSKTGYVQHDRTGDASYVDRYGSYVWANKTTTTNYIPYSYDLSQWNDTFGLWTYIGTTTDPDGGTNASEINLDSDTGATTNGVLIVPSAEFIGLTTNTFVTLSFQIKVISGTVTSVDVSFATSTTIRYELDTPTSDYIRVSYPVWVTGTNNLFISPRGETGARVAISQVQLEDTLVMTDFISTTGNKKTRTNEVNIWRGSDKGYLLEEGKTNLVQHSNDLSEWAISSGSIAKYAGGDLFGNTNQLISLVYDSLPEITLTVDTDVLTPAQTYSVSVFAYITAGSLESIYVSLGGGVPVLLGTPAVTGFVRLSVKCVASGDDNLQVVVTSPSLSAQLLFSCWQVEEDEPSSPILTGETTLSRNADNVDMNYDYSAPLPSAAWSYMFTKKDMLNDSNVKTIFSNGQLTTNEFSLKYTDRILTLNMGSNISSFDTFDYEDVTITYDGADVKFYGGITLLQTETVSSTSHIATTLYFGYNGVDEFLNANLSYSKFYPVELTLNDIIYLGVQ